MKTNPPASRNVDGRFVAVLLSVALTALAVRLTYVAARHSTDGPDSLQYRTLAENIGKHRSFSLDSTPPFGPTIRRAPLYPLFLTLAGETSEASSGDRARVWQSVLDSLVAAMICLILHGPVRLRWTFAAGIAYAIHPAALHYASMVLSESFFTFVVTLAVTTLVFGIRRDKLSWIFAAGLLMGLAALVRPVAALFFIPVAAGIWLSRKSIGRPVTIAVVFSVAALGTMTPWIVRSSVMAGQFVLVSATGPAPFALAAAPEPWNLNDEASIWGNERYWRTDPCGRALAEARTPPESARADRICLHTALANLREHPRHYLRSRVSQLVRFPVTSFDVATGNTTSFPAALRERAWKVLAMKAGLFMFFSVVPLLAGAIGLFAGRCAVEKAVCGALWVFTIVIHAPGFVEYRFFFPAVPMLLVSAAWAIDALERTALARGSIAASPAAS